MSTYVVCRNKFHDGSENMNEDDVSDESTDVAEEDWAGLD